MDEISARFRASGFVHLPGFWTTAEIDDLRREIDAAAACREGSSSIDDGAMTFYSLLFPLRPALRRFISDQRLLDVLSPIAGPDLWVRWDQAVAKRPGAPTFPWHQDNGYSRLHVQHIQVWVALTDAGPDDGGLWVAPGSHDERRTHHAEGPHVAVDEIPAHGIPIVAETGDLVVFSSRLVHRTTPNESDRDRWTYVIEYLECGHFDPYVHPPYLQVSREGRTDLQTVNWPPGRRSPREQLRYLPDRIHIRRTEGSWRRGL